MGGSASRIHRADVAAVCVAALSAPEAANVTLEESGAHPLAFRDRACVPRLLPALARVSQLSAHAPCPGRPCVWVAGRGVEWVVCAVGDRRWLRSRAWFAPGGGLEGYAKQLEDMWAGLKPDEPAAAKK
jgi:hypothetical protein